MKPSTVNAALWGQVQWNLLCEAKYSETCFVKASTVKHALWNQPSTVKPALWDQTTVKHAFWNQVQWNMLCETNKVQWNLLCEANQVQWNLLCEAKYNETCVEAKYSEACFVRPSTVKPSLWGLVEWKLVCDAISSKKP